MTATIWNSDPLAAVVVHWAHGIDTMTINAEIAAVMANRTVFSFGSIVGGMEHFVVLGMNGEIGVITFVAGNTIALSMAACAVWISNVIGVFAVERDPMDFVVHGNGFHCSMAINTALWHCINRRRVIALFLRNAAVTAFA
jgi:hypothetical protein